MLKQSKNTYKINLLTLAIASVVATQVSAQNEQESNNSNPSALEETLVLAKQTTYANSVVDDAMREQQTAITSVLAVVDNLPGVLINEGDTFGADDWSTTISMRGFQVSLDEQQIGMTIDGIPNGNSNYGGGSKANRFIDTENLQTVEVSQGTADIASRSHEALGGSLNFVTQDPLDETRMRFSLTSADFDGRKYYVRYDTGEFAGNTRAWLSLSSLDTKAWIDESGESNRDHFAAKFISEFSAFSMTGYLAYDESHEDNYQRITMDEFRQNPDWDRLTGDWLGIPHIDQLYRRGWSTLRENTLGYLRFDFDLDENVHLQVTPYFHENEGRGDWLPPYLVDVRDDGAAEAHSEIDALPDTVFGGSSLGQIQFVDANGLELAPNPGCESALVFPYGGAGPEYDVNCYDPGAIPVGSFRHTHYSKDRLGFTADLDWTLDLAGFENVVRAGLWYQDETRKEWRDWHKVIDSLTSYHFDHVPYWVQYSREYPQETLMYYIEDSISFDKLTVSLGGKQWQVETKREDLFAGAAGAGSVNSDSDFLLNAGIHFQATDGLEVFAGYAENYASVKDVVLEAADIVNNPNALDDIEPETAENFDAGLRYNGERFDATLTYYDINFENRITFIPEGGIAGIDYLGEVDGAYVNVGGITSDGVEASATWYATDNIHVYLSYTVNDSVYGNGFVISGDQIPEGNTVFGSAEDMWVVSVDWRRDDYNAGLSAKQVGERWMDPLNTVRIDAYNVVDFYASVSGDEIGGFKGYQLKFTVNNLLDEDYIGGVAGGWGGWLGSGRTAAFNLVLDF